MKLDDIQKKITYLGTRIDLPRGMVLFIQDKPVDNATPYLEIKGGKYNYVIRERGLEIVRKETADIDEFMYWFFEDITSELSLDYEFENRVKGQDTRRIAFSKQQELLEQLNPLWATRWFGELQNLLSKYPYDDDSSKRVDLCKKLSKEGLSADDAYEHACKHYPLPS